MYWYKAKEQGINYNEMLLLFEMCVYRKMQLWISFTSHITANAQALPALRSIPAAAVA